MLVIAVATSFGAPNPGAPGPAREMEALFDHGSLDGQVWVTAPLKTVSGNDLSGYINYRMLMNGSVVNSDRIFYGTSKATDVSVPEPGIYEFTVIFSNDFGDSEPCSVTVGVGIDEPEAPTVSAASDGSKITVSWNAVDRDVSGGTLTDVTYRVVRESDVDEVVADGITATSYVDVPPASDRAIAYNYRVYAMSRSTSSAPGVSNHVVWGAMIPPYTEDFADMTSLDKFVQIDANGDGRLWDFYYGELYIHDTSNDWLISPPIKVDASSYYTVGLRVKARNAGFPPKFRLCWGTAPTVAAMTNVAIATTEVASESYVLYTMNIHPGVDGNIYLGVLNEINGDGMLITDLSISAPIEVTTPGALKSFSAESDVSGARRVTVKLTAPDRTIDDKPLASISKIEVYRGETLVNSFSNPAPGASLECEDSGMSADGEYVYTAMAYGAFGPGPKTETKVFVGINVPASPQWARATETDVNGVVKVEWDVPTTYKDGRPIDPQTITYNIYTYIGGSDVKIHEGLTGNSHTFTAFEEGALQYMLYFCVTAQNSAGENLSPAFTEMIPLGEPYAAPYEDSFPLLEPLYLYGLGTEEYRTYWDFASDTTYEGISTYDGDGGMLALYGQETGYSASIFSGKIDLQTLNKPALSFYVNNNAADADNTLEILLNDRSGWKSVCVKTVGSLGGNGWRRVVVPLGDYSGKDVQFKFVGKTVSSTRILIDNIRIVDRYDHDVAVTDVRVPAGVKAGNDVSIGIDYSNEGLQDSGTVTIDFLVDGVVSESRSIPSLSSDAKGSETFTVHHDVNTPASRTYRVNVRTGVDDQPANNTSGDCIVATRFPQYPAVSDLRATYGEQEPSKVTLSWSAPNLDTELVDDITDGFEEYDDWATSIDNWTFYDQDRGDIYGFGMWVEIPGIEVGSQQSWWVMNGDYPQLYNHFFPQIDTRAHGGSKYLVQNAVLRNDVEAKSDDWAVSPRLYGGAQTVSLWARSFYDTDPETFEFLVSKSGTEIADFELMRTISKVPGDWTQYFFELPEGSRHFAVRAISRDCFMLMLDDVSFIPEARATELTPAGYNVYRDGVRLNSEPVMTPRYEVEDAAHTSFYRVSALYAGRGESPLSAAVSATLSGLNDAYGESVSVLGLSGALRVLGGAGCQLSVCGIDGRTVASRVASGDEEISLPAGVYVVVLGNNSYKVVVK